MYNKEEYKCKNVEGHKHSLKYSNFSFWSEKKKNTNCKIKFITISKSNLPIKSSDS